VAALHDAWAEPAGTGPCPGVLNRLRVLAENAALLAAGPGAQPPVSPLLDPLLRRAATGAARRAPGAARALRPWEHHPFTLYPCVRDLRGEHVLFDGGRVGGIVDFGAAAVDHPAVDLARLLADFAAADDLLSTVPAGTGCSGGDDQRFAAGLTAYRAARPAFDAPDDLVRLLAHTGTVCSLIGWLVRLTVRREAVADPAAAAVRLAALVARADRYEPL
jgi:homoserine kinase type II